MEFIKKIIDQLNNLGSVGQFCVHLIGVILLLIAGFFVAKIAKRMIIKVLQRTHIDETLGQFLGKGAYWLILVIVVLACLSLFGIQTTSVAAIIAAAGLAVGLAFQGTLSNFAAGVMIIAFRPFKIHDVVTVDGQTGEVNEIDFFQTTLTTPDNRRIIVPNSKIFGSTIENVTASTTRRIDVAINISLNASTDETKKTLLAATQVEGALAEPASTATAVDLTESAIKWNISVWAKTSEFGAVREKLLLSIKKSLDDAKIETPSPQITVRNKS
ncbi:MAG: mechanosensitive ion channel [Proteobacteria bacterium]|nr:mechanosensitive ion channel [Pseudomonadota bacterium]